MAFPPTLPKKKSKSGAPKPKVPSMPPSGMGSMSGMSGGMAVKAPKFPFGGKK